MDISKMPLVSTTSLFLKIFYISLIVSYDMQYCLKNWFIMDKKEQKKIKWISLSLLHRFCLHI